MKIYKITRKEYCYDEYDSHVIVCNNRKKAREMALEVYCYRPESGWDIAKVVCHGEYNGNRKNPFILLSSFNAG